ncbi:hypothetical protein PVL29_023979 [Vitis rotundifolia]|uniref:Jasmonate O-methyltransferase n=2 Tax=Vitis rotundifolia TaxID=103349 RepID=A0AA39D953_VITRO|nr:hypothetical protein PVL29_023979 [Vitis rotundifolia]
MEVMQVLHMNKGAGETSYATNSTVQTNIISTAKPVTEEAILDIFNHVLPESVGIADLGCSSGPNTLLVVSEILNVIYAKWQQLGRPCSPEFRVYLNDLIGNDFNNVFGSLPAFYNKLKEEKGSEFGPCFISGAPGSFYGRVFPSKSLHFVHSSSSLHWLSQVPPGLASKDGRGSWNKGKIYISKTSPDCVLEAYSSQFQKDWSVFLKSRAEEIVGGGRMVLSFMGRRSTDPRSKESCYQWELLARALMSMVSEGLIEEKKVDSFNAPYYAPSPEEVKFGIYKEGSFILDRLEMFEIDWDGGDGDGDNYDATPTSSTLSNGARVAKTIRAVVESMLESHFGGDVMDGLFQRYGEMVGNHLAKTRAKYTNLVISLARKV